MNLKLGYIGEQLAAYPPRPYFTAERLKIFKEIDRILLDGALTSKGGEFDIGDENRHVKDNPIRDLYVNQMFKAIKEIETCTVKTGIVIWQLYNMGYIVKTPTATLGFDVVRGLQKYNWGWEIPDAIPRELVRCMDVLFVTHYVDHYHKHSTTWWHTDHCDRKIISLMQEAGKDVLLPSGNEDYFKNQENIVFVGDNHHIELPGMRISAFIGPHVYQDNSAETPLRVYKVVTGEGKKIFFTGDFDYITKSAVPDQTDLDVLFLRCGGVSPLYDDQNPYDLGDDEDAFFLGTQKFHAKFVVAGHLGELSHPPGGGRESYVTAYKIFTEFADKARINQLIMFWGEKYHCEG